jgi:uncharacterized protein (UPF0332 family)
MPKQPPVHETEFLKISRNHRELARTLSTIGIQAPEVLEYAKQLSKCWFTLAEEHLREANAALAAHCERAVFSRSYYAAYNASKAVRYITNGAVSVKSDDHSKASADLPSDLPNVDQRAQEITQLYEHRLRADYDNWSDTTTSNTLTPADAISLADAFISEVRAHVNQKFGHVL